MTSEPRVAPIGPLDRETFDRAQRRHRRSARLRAIPAVIAAAVMGIPLGVYLSPILIALGIVLTDLVNLVIPMPDVGGAVSRLLDGLVDGDPSTLGALAMILLIWVIPGIALLVVAYILMAWRLRRIGGDGIALAIGGRPPRPDDRDEQQLVNIARELGIAAGIEPPRVLIYDDRPANAFVFGRDPDHATIVVSRAILTDLDREATQGVVGRLVASAVDGDLGLATDIGAVYVTYGLLTTALSAVVSHKARIRLRAAIGPLFGRSHDPRADAVGLAALLGLADDDDTPDNAASGCLTLLTMGGMIAIGISIINLFLAGPLLTFAWRSRGYLADATAVELTRDPDGLASALRTLGGGGAPGTAWLELLLLTGGGGTTKATGDALPRLSDGGLAVSLNPPIASRLRRLVALGADAPAIEPAPSMRFGRAGVIPARGLPRWLGLVIIGPLLVIVAVLAAVAAALLVWLVALAAFIVLAVVAGPLHEILRGFAGR